MKVYIYEDNAGGISYVVGSTCYALGWGLPDGAGLKDLGSDLDWLSEHTELSKDDLSKVLEDDKLIAMRRSDGVIVLDIPRMGAAARRYFGLGD